MLNLISSFLYSYYVYCIFRLQSRKSGRLLLQSFRTPDKSKPESFASRLPAMDLLSLLPENLMSCVMEFLPLSDLIAVIQVNRYDAYMLFWRNRGGRQS